MERPLARVVLAVIPTAVQRLISSIVAICHVRASAQHKDTYNANPSIHQPPCHSTINNPIDNGRGQEELQKQSHQAVRGRQRSLRAPLPALIPLILHNCSSNFPSRKSKKARPSTRSRISTCRYLQIAPSPSPPSPRARSGPLPPSHPPNAKARICLRPTSSPGT